MEPIEMRWEAPAECPDGPSVVRRAGEILGRPAQTGGGERLAVTAVVEATADGYRLELETSMAHGSTRRSMTDPRCEVLAEVAAVVVAVAIDPLSALQSSPSPAPEPPEPPPPAPEPPPPLPPPAAAPSPAGAFGAVRVAALVEAGALPRVGPGLELAGGVWLRRAAIEVHGVALFPRTERAASDPDVGARLWSWGVGARGCASPATRRVSFPICLGAEGGAMVGRGIGLERPAAASRPWVAALLGPRLVWRPIRRLGVWVGADLVVALVRPGFGIDFVGPVHRAGVVSGRGGAGLEVRFP